MKVISFVALCAVLVAMVAAAPKPEEKKYTTKYDHVNVQEILKNNRLREGYLKCLKGGPVCTPEGTELKSHLADAINTECAKCSETQKAKSEEVLEYLVLNHKDEFDELVKIYDPKGEHKEAYNKFVKKVTKM